MTVKKHKMYLHPCPFKHIKEGRKTIELRLYDDKRKNISIGDTILFVNTENETDTISAVVKNLFVFESFDELYKKLPLLKCGYTDYNIDSASPKDMQLYYSIEEQKRYGVVGIEIEIIHQ